MDRNEFPYFKASILEDIIEEELVEVKVKAGEKSSGKESQSKQKHDNMELPWNPAN